MAPEIPNIDLDRHLDPGVAAWYFRNEVLRRFFHPHSVALLSATGLILLIGNFATAGSQRGTDLAATKALSRASQQKEQRSCALLGERRHL
ncbi:MAG: hypothetical protein WA869_28120 [Alloacidobacterium sp.]|jgi:hypothetical protein